ncbi:MAG: hypothetical protein ACKO3B_09480, partial [Bacteroidota bacterium]
MRTIVHLLLVSMPWTLVAQAPTPPKDKSSINWYFGNSGNGLRFGRLDAKPTVKNDKLPSFGSAGAGTVSDPVTGNLLFYTDGSQVVDVLGQPMPNGSGLSGNPASNQPVAVCPVPGQPGKYFIFTNSASVTAGGSVTYSVVDMALFGNGIAPAPGLGDVDPSRKNIGVPGLTGVSEAMILVPHSNGTDFWLITQQFFSRNFSASLVSAASYTAAAFPPTTTAVLTLPLVASHLGYHQSSGKLAVACSRPPVDTPPPLTDAVILNFNAGSGILTFNQYMFNSAVEGTNNQAIYDIEFSPDGKLVYYTVFDGTDPEFPSGLYR